MNKRVAVVTGAYKGIGKKIVRGLAREGLTVILTSRNAQKGEAVVHEFNKEELPVRYFNVDVTHATSIRQLEEFMKSEYGRCDVLVNNAGIFPDESGATIATTEIEKVREAMETNVYGPFMLCQALVPLMKKNNYGRIVNISSGMGQLCDMNGGSPAYRMSKTAINALTRILSQETASDNILVNSMCPGWVKTDMGGPGATRTPQQGADTAIWLSTLPDDGPTGKFFRDRQVIPW